MATTETTDPATGPSEVLGRLLDDVRPSGAAPRPPGTLREWGLSSLGLTRLWLEIQECFGLDVPVEQLADATADDLLAAVAAARPGAAPGPGPARSDRPGDAFPLSPLQRAYVAAAESDLGGETVGCHLYREFDVTDVDPDRLRAGWQRLVDHHDALRVVVDEERDQRVLAAAGPWSMPVHDLRAHPSEDLAGHLAAVRERMSTRQWPVGAWPSFAIEVTLAPGGHDVVHLAVDTLVVDAHGVAILIDQWHALHRDPAAGLPASGTGLRDACLTLHRLRTDPARSADLAHWLTELADLPPDPAPVRTPPAPPPGGCRPRSGLDAVLDPGVWSAVRAAAEEYRVTPTALVLEVFAAAWERVGAVRPFPLVVTTSDRPRLGAGAAGLVGAFTSTAVHVVDDAEGLDVGEAAFEAQRRLSSHLRHGMVSGIDALRAVAGPSGRRTPPPVVFTSLLGIPMDGGFGAATRWASSRTGDVALDHQMWEDGGGLRLHWDVDPSRFAPGVVETAFAHLVTALSATGPGPEDVRAPAPLTQSYVVARVAEPADAQGCQCYRTYDVEDLDVARLESALDRLTRDHDALRARYGSSGVRVAPSGRERWRVPVVVTSAAIHERTVERIRADLTTRPFPLDRRPPIDVRVVRDERGRSTVHGAIDLVVGDAPSIHTLFRELWRYYDDPAAAPRDRGQAARREPPRPTGPDPHQRLAALPPGPALPPGVAVDRRRDRFSARVRGYRELTRTAAARSLRVDDVLLAAFTRAVSRWCRGRWALAVVTFPAAEPGRGPGEHSAMTWLEAFPADRDLLDAASAYRALLDADATGDPERAWDTMRRLSLTEGRTHPVVYTAVVDLTGDPLPRGVTEGPWATSTPGCAVDCVAVADGDELDLGWDVAPRALPGVDVGVLFSAFVRSVAELAGPDLAEPPAPDDGPVHTLFEHHARERPDAVALTWRGGGVLHYGELNARANRIARRLRELGIGPGRVVGIRIRRGPDMVAAVHGVLKAGGAYLPLDPALPPARTRSMVALADAALVLTHSGTPAVDLGVAAVEVDSDPAVLRGDGTDLPPSSTADDPAYVIFTSGSTGEPKGVEVAHRSVRNLLAFCGEEFPTSAGDMGLGVTSLSFDLSVYDVLGLLGSGAALYLADEEQQRDPGLLLDVLLSEPVTLWNSAPTTLHQLTPLLQPHGGDPATTRLRLVLLSGDFIPLSLPGQVTAAFPRAETIALGGPTETTVWSNVFRFDTVDPRWRAIPYGRAIPNTRHHVLDDELRPCPVGVEGELYTAGACLATGYRGRPDLTAERFVPDPFGEPGERMFRTGDRAYLGADGNLHIVGRTDGQVKVRGHRVELGEIEFRLREHPAVTEAMVLPRRTAAGDTLLVAYVLLRADHRHPAPTELRAHAAETLPEYMVPNIVHGVGSFPATPNGKLDRDALPWPLPDPTAARPSPPATGPTDPAELIAHVTETVRTLLEVPSVGLDEDLWELGATSFTMVRMSAALKRRWNRRLPVSALVSEPTVAGIARALGHRLGAGGSPAPAPAPAAEAPAPRIDDTAGPSRPPAVVDLFSPEERAAFRAARWNRRRPAGTARVPLQGAAGDPGVLDARRTRREFDGPPLDVAAVGRFLAHLRAPGPAGATRYRYPSAGDTYSVQVYLHVKPGAVAGLDGGIHYYDPDEHALHLVNPDPRIDRGVHFYYNRPVFDAAAFSIHLIGQRHGIEPIYQEFAERFLTLEAGHIGQLLMSVQAECGIGLCPVGAMADDGLREEFGLDDGHVLLHTLLAGPITPAPADPDPAPPAGHDAPDRTPSPGPAPARTPSARISSAGPAPAQPLAVIGAAGRFSGAADLAGYWRMLRDGATGIGPPAPGRSATVGGDVGGFLPDAEAFDALRFRIAPSEAAVLDPQLRLLLATVAACLDDAGHTPDTLRSTAPRVGVFVATMWQDHQLVGLDSWRSGAGATRAGLAGDIPNRISHAFGLDGPSVAMNTSCSSSLAALHLAAASLRSGECDAAVVGAANLVLHPYHLALLAAAGNRPGAGGGRAFAASGSGWWPGEGAAAVLLRPVGAALRAGDHVGGVVEATAIGFSGAGVYGRPDAEALGRSVSGLLDRAGVGAADVDYVECAAAGAALADAAEIEALAEVFAGVPVLAGTVKPNIGHLEAAAGLSQVLKVLLQQRHSTVAPTLMAPDRSPLVDWDAVPLRFPTRATPWPRRSTARRALVNAVAASGAHGHALLRAVEPGEERR